MTAKAVRLASTWLLLREQSTVMPNGCKVWNGARSKDGYGVIYIAGKRHFVHRLGWELARGPVPKGMGLLHDPVLCNSRACWNDAHLRLGTAKENAADRKRAAGERA